MEKKNNCVKVGFSTILWAVMAILLCAAPSLRADETVPFGETWDIPGIHLPNPIIGSLWIEGTANLLTGASVSDSIYVQTYGILNMYSGTIGDYSYISVSPDAVGMTVYGTGFHVGATYYDTPTSVPITSGILEGTYGNGNTIYLWIMSGIPINLAAPGEPSENEPPVANAGDDVTILSNELAFTVIQGTATDQDEDALQYRWLEGTIEFTLWASVGVNGEAPLDLGTILPEYLGVGTHTLTLEVKDGTVTVSDDMVLTIEIAVNIEIEKAKVSWDHSDIHVYGKLYLPQGFWMDNLNPNGSVVTTLAKVGVVNQDVEFELKGKKGDKWEYKDKENSVGNIKEFKIDWKGAKFEYKGDEGLHIHTHHIGGNETTLCIHCDHISGAFTVSVNGTTIEYNEDRIITTGVEYDPQKDDNTHVHFPLPFQLTPDMSIEVSGAIELTIDVADYYEEGFVKFKLVSIFDPDDPELFPEGSESSPEELEIEISLGKEPNKISGSDLIDAWTKKDDKHWDYK